MVEVSPCVPDLDSDEERELIADQVLTPNQRKRKYLIMELRKGISLRKIEIISYEKIIDKLTQKIDNPFLSKSQKIPIEWDIARCEDTIEKWKETIDVNEKILNLLNYDKTTLEDTEKPALNLFCHYIRVMFPSEV